MSGVTLNIDLGELPGEPEELYALATQVNVACGGHAGDPASMRHACQLARAHGCAVAAHPSYPDREGFGRARPTIALEALRASLVEQCRALRDAAEAEGAIARIVKPHGALYHDVASDDALAAMLVDAVHSVLGDDVSFVGATSGALARVVARQRGASVIAEAFADRAYDGEQLRPRTREGALITDPELAAAQALSFARSGRFGTLCVHGDTPGAVAIAQRVRLALEGAGLLR